MASASSGSTTASSSYAEAGVDTLELSTGNVDMDRQDEIAIVINESFGTSNLPDGVSRRRAVPRRCRCTR